MSGTKSLYIHVRNPSLASNVVRDFSERPVSRKPQRTHKTASVFICSDPSRSRGETIYDYLRSDSKKVPKPLYSGKKNLFVRKVQKQTLPRERLAYRYHPLYNLQSNKAARVKIRREPFRPQEVTNVVTEEGDVAATVLSQEEQERLIADPATVLNGPVEERPYHEFRHVLFTDPQEAAAMFKEMRSEDGKAKAVRLKKFQRAVRRRVRQRIRRRRADAKFALVDRKGAKRKSLYEEKVMRAMKKKEYGNRVNLENSKRHQVFLKKRTERMEKNKQVLEQLKQQESRAGDGAEEGDAEDPEVVEPQPASYNYVRPPQTASEKMALMTSIPSVAQRSGVRDDDDVEEATFGSSKSSILDAPLPVPRRSLRLTLVDRARERKIKLPSFCSCGSIDRHCHNCTFHRRPDILIHLIKSYLESAENARHRGKKPKRL